MSMKIQILSNKPQPSTPTHPEPSHFSDEETEAQREIAMGAGSHSMSGQNESRNPGSHGQGLGSPHDARGPLLPIQQECQGPKSLPSQKEAMGRQDLVSGPQGILGAV